MRGVFPTLAEDAGMRSWPIVMSPKYSSSSVRSGLLVNFAAKARRTKLRCALAEKTCGHISE